MDNTGVTKMAYSVKEVASITSLSIPFIRKEIRDQKMKSKKAGRRVLILHTDLKHYLENGNENN